MSVGLIFGQCTMVFANASLAPSRLADRFMASIRSGASRNFYTKPKLVFGMGSAGHRLTQRSFTASSDIG